MFRFSFAVCLFVAIGTATAAPVPTIPIDPTKDREGNPLPKGATARLGSLSFRGDAEGLTFSPDGKQLVHLDRGTLRGWDVDSGRLIETRSYEPKGSEESRYASQIVGDRIISVGWDKKEKQGAVVSELIDGKERSRFRFTPGNPYVYNLNFVTRPAGHLPPAAVSPDGKYLAALLQTQKAISVFDTTTGKTLFSQSVPEWVRAGVYITPDSRALFVYEDGKPLRRYELASGKELAKFDETDKHIHRLVVSPDGKRALTGGYTEGKREPRWPNQINKIEDDFLILRDAETGKPTGRLPLGRIPRQVRFVGPDAAIVLSCTNEWVGRTFLSRWNLGTLKREWEVPCPESMWLALAPDGKRIALATFDSAILIHDADTGKRTGGPTGHLGAIVWIGISADGKTITTLGGSLLDCPAEDVAVWTANGECRSQSPIAGLRHGQFMWTGTDDHPVWLTGGDDVKEPELIGWDRDKNAIAWRLKPEGTVARAFSHDGKRVVALSWDKDLKRWDATVYDGPAGKRIGGWTVPDSAKKGAEVALGENRAPAMTLSGDGKLMLIGGDDVVGVDALTGRFKVRIDTGWIEPDGPYLAPLALSADGSRLSVVEKTRVRIFDVKSSDVLVRHTVGTPFARSKFSPDGKRLAVWSTSANTVSIYDAESDAKPRVLDGGVRPTAVTFSPDGNSLVVGYSDGTALIWDLTTK